MRQLVTLVLALLGCIAAPAWCAEGEGGGDACRVVTDAGSVLVGSGVAGDPAAPEPATGYRTGRRVVTAGHFMVVSANPLASAAGCGVLARGGSAVDAAVAVQAVLGLVEPQSSGLGGGSFMLHYRAADATVTAYDGRETAPAAARPDDLRWIDDADRTPPRPSPRASGRSIGTPGTLRLLELAHREQGRLPWRDLFAPAIRLASEGFPISGRLAAAIATTREGLKADPEAAAAYLEADGSPKALGTRLRMPDYARTLSLIAAAGPDAFYQGPIARVILDKIGATTTADGSPITPGRTTLADLAGYQAKRREPVCTRYRRWEVCGMPPPSSGGITVAATLGILESFDLAQHPPAPVAGSGLAEGGRPPVAAVHLVSEAERLAYADRNRYLADTDFVPLPGGRPSGGPGTLLDPGYLRARAALIRPDRSLGRAAPGVFPAAPGTAARPVEEHGTSHFSIVDREGNVVAMTSSVESAFGSWHLAAGVVLNNQLTDFDAVPLGEDGSPVANALAPGKRPRSSMSPTLVFEVRPDGGRGAFVLATGSPGGAAIMQSVVKTLIGVLDWGLDAQEAANLMDFGAANTPVTYLGGEHPLIDTADDGARDPLVTGLRALGHRVDLAARISGIATIRRGTHAGRAVLSGGADPRREGLAVGDPEVRP